MLARLFGQTNSATVLLLLLYALLLGGAHFFLHPVVAETVVTPLGSLLLPVWAGYSLQIIALLIVFFGYQWLVYGKYRMVKQHAFVPVVALPLWLVGLLNGGALFAFFSVLLLFVFRLWFAAYQGQSMLSNSLNIGFLIGLGSLFGLGAVYLLLFTPLVFTVFGRINGRTFLIPLIGYLTIWIDAIALDYLLTDSSSMFKQFGQHFWVNGPAQVPLNLKFVWVLAIFLVPGLTEFSVTFSRANVFKRQAFTLLVLFIGLAVAVYFLHGFHPLQLAMLTMPISILYVNYIQYLKKKWVQELLLWGILAAFLAFELGVV